MASLAGEGAVPSALDDALAAPDANGGIPQAATASASTENGGSSPADATAPSKRRRSIASLAFPNAAPDYDIGPAPASLSGNNAPPAPPSSTSPTTTTASTTTGAPPGAPALRSVLRPASPNNHVPSRRSSILSERASVLERLVAEAQVALETENQLRARFTAVEEQVSRLERELEDVQQAVEGGRPYRGKEGRALAAEEERLARKELLLREKEGRLHEDIRVHMRIRCDQQRRASEVARQRRVKFPDDTEQERQAQQRIVPTEDSALQRQRISSGAGLESASNIGGSERNLLQDFNDTSSAREARKLEEDPRLVVRMEAFNLPVLVGTLLCGFTLVLFDVATTELARRLAVLAFSLEISSSTVLCWIMFHGQQLYSRSSFDKQRTRPFLKSTCTATVVSLAMFSLGVAAFVVSFLVEASDEVGDLWLAIFAVILCPTVLAASLFAASTAKLRRLTLTPPVGSE